MIDSTPRAPAADLPPAARRGSRAIVHTLAPTFTVGAICVIERADGAMLLVRHAYRRRWGLPGGLLNRGEDPRDAAKREALEEVGVEIETGRRARRRRRPPTRRVDVDLPRPPRRTASSPDATDRSQPRSSRLAGSPADELPELQHETAGALVALARARRPVSQNGEPER